MGAWQETVIWTIKLWDTFHVPSDYMLGIINVGCSHIIGLHKEHPMNWV